MITINGDIYITNYGQTLDELVGEELPFNHVDDIDDFGISGFGKGYDEDYTEDCDLECDGNCYDCEYGDGDEDDEEDDSLNPLEKLIEEYAEFLVDENLCIDCVKNVLENFVYELISEED